MELIFGFFLLCLIIGILKKIWPFLVLGLICIVLFSILDYLFVDVMRLSWGWIVGIFGVLMFLGWAFSPNASTDREQKPKTQEERPALEERLAAIPEYTKRYFRKNKVGSFDDVANFLYESGCVYEDDPESALKEAVSIMTRSIKQLQSNGYISVLSKGSDDDVSWLSHFPDAQIDRQVIRI
ncbi:MULTISPECIES: hypothetical protein [Neisseria]|nr:MULTISPECIES: hypothetical protein [Neisseria]MBD0764460.1 hypothetical protein [Neisseria sp. RH3002v2f]